MFKVKVTTKVQNVNECLFGWYLLNCKTFCSQTWCGDAASWARKMLAIFKVKVTAKAQNVDECLSRLYSLLPNILSPNLAWWCIMSQSVMQRDWFATFNLKVTARTLMIKIWQILLSSELLILLLANLIWWYVIITSHLGVLYRNWIAVFKVKVTAELQNVSECLLRWYFLNHRTFYYQNWCCDASSWARVSFKKIDFLSSRSRSQWRIIWSKHDFLIYLLSYWSCATKLGLVWWCIIMGQSVMQEDLLGIFKVKVTMRAYFIMAVCTIST